MKVLYSFTSSKLEPFFSLQRKGADQTWRTLVSSGNRSIAVYAKSTNIFCIFHRASIMFEKLRWGRWGRFFTLTLRILFLPLRWKFPKWKEVNGDLHVNIPEGLTFLGFKMLAAIDYAVKNHFDYLVLTNLSSYPVCSAVERFLLKFSPQEDLYAGKRLPSEINHGISGSFVILSSSTCKKILVSRRLWDHSSLDDIALMKITKRLGIYPLYTTSKTFLSSLEPKNLEEIFNEEILHYKCGPFLENGIRVDFTPMQKLHNFFQG